MKSVKSFIVLMFTLVTTVTAHAENPTLVVEPKAQVKICPPRIAGCANKITIQGTDYIIGYNEANNVGDGITNLLNSLITACRDKKIYTSPTFVAEGFIVREKGHFPNPTVEFDVFKISYLAEVFLP
jgi:hypothetical protein